MPLKKDPLQTEKRIQICLGSGPQEKAIFGQGSKKKKKEEKGSHASRTMVGPSLCRKKCMCDRVLDSGNTDLM